MMFLPALRSDFEQPSFSSFTTTRVGWTVGGGIEWAYNNNWIVGVEYRYSDFGHYANYHILNDLAFIPGEVIIANHHLTQNRVQARVSYKFDWFNPVVARY